MIEVARSLPQQEVDLKEAHPSIYEGPPFCGWVGCGDPAVARIEHPEHGRRTVCETHIAGFPVVEVIEP